MPIYTDVRKAIRLGALAALSEYPTTPVIFSHNNGTEPAESYVVINILNIEQQGHHSTSAQTRTDYKLDVRVVYEVMVQFSFVGSLSGDMSQSFTQRINNVPVSREALTKNNLAFMRKSQIRRAPQKRDTKWVEYHNLDVTFNYIVNTSEISDWVESIIVDSEQTGVFTVPEGIIIP
jgi:hypothetical protein